MTNSTLTWKESITLLEKLPFETLESRCNIIISLARNSSPWIRQRALMMGATLLSSEQLVSFLRDEADDVLRNIGLEILKHRGSSSLPLALELLRDNDPDVVLQAILIIDHIRDPRALEALRPLLKHQNENIIQSAIIAIGHIGDERVVSDLLPFLTADIWLQMAAIQALGDLRSPQAIKSLQALLSDMMIGPLVAESLARIGGFRVFRAIAHYWLEYYIQVDLETTLSLLTHILEGLHRFPSEILSLRQLLESLLNNAKKQVQNQAARCLLAHGPGSTDKCALDILATSMNEYKQGQLPACLAHRKDLCSYLIANDGTLFQWGLQLTARYPHSITIDNAVSLLHRANIEEHLDQIKIIIERMRNPCLTPYIFNIFCHISREARLAFLPIIIKYRRYLRAFFITNKTGLDAETGLIFRSIIGAKATVIARLIMKLNQEAQLSIISILSFRKDVIRLLPWGQWLSKYPDLYISIAAEVITKTHDREILHLLRNVLKTKADKSAIRAVGELADRKSIPILLHLLPHVEPLVRAIIIESLGRIGGPEARLALRELAQGDTATEERIAFHALSQCAVEEDIEFFVAATKHPDWMVRFAAVEVLGRYPNPTSIHALETLTSDPTAIIARRAISFLTN
ncbi:HEAT repeat domain-containing protein [bacterium]|nr:HEAT repeat domain-containing protein [bacterium]